MTTHIRLRKLALTLHVTFSVGLLGAIAAFLVLAVTGVTSQNLQVVRAVYPAMQPIARLVIVPMTCASLLTGLVQSWASPWGLFRHYWVLVKLLLTVVAAAVLLLKLTLIDRAAELATATVLPLADLREMGVQLAVHAGSGLLVLFVPVVLSIYKPPGLTRYGWRKQLEQSAQPG